MAGGYWVGELALCPRTPDLGTHHHPASTLAPESGYLQILIPLLVLGLLLALGAGGLAYCLRR